MKDSDQQMNMSDGTTQNTNAMSVFNPVGISGDFPVLKAFQEYLDAEQAKARKRMLGLSIFFIVLLVVVVVTFTLVMTAIINRNQSLSDRLLDLALRDKTTTQPVVNVQSSPPQPIVHAQPQPEALNPVLQKFDKLAEALVQSQQQTKPSSDMVAELARLKDELSREKEARKADAAKAAARAKEEKRKAEVEAHRRRLYPEYYARQDAQLAVLERKAPTLSAPLVQKTSAKPKVITPINYFNEHETDEELVQLLADAKRKSQSAVAPSASPSAQPPVGQIKPAVKVSAVQKPEANAAGKTPVQKTAVAQKPTAKPQPAQKAETLSIKTGTNDANSITWFIEPAKR